MGELKTYRVGERWALGTVLSLGFLIIASFGFVGAGTIYLGYRLILFGTTNSFNFTSDLKGWKLGLASTSPGLFLVLCGAAICLYVVRLLAKIDHRSSKSRTRLGDGLP